MSRNAPAANKTDGPSSTACVDVSRPCGSSAAQHCICAAQRSRAGLQVSDVMRTPCSHPPRPPARRRRSPRACPCGPPRTAHSARACQRTLLFHGTSTLASALGGSISGADSRLVQRLHHAFMLLLLLLLACMAERPRQPACIPSWRQNQARC